MGRHPVGRREAIRQLAVLAAGLAAACTPLRIVTRSYPEDFERDRDLVDRVLRAFVITVIPGAPANARDLVRAYRDPKMPFASYAPFFASDLCRRTRERFGHREFDVLTGAERERIIADGFTGDATMRKLYSGAVYLAQISFYAGIYDDEGGCPLIDFPGRFRGEVVTHSEPERFLPLGLTTSGNFA